LKIPRNRLSGILSVKGKESIKPYPPQASLWGMRVTDSIGWLCQYDTTCDFIDHETVDGVYFPCKEA